MERKLLISDLKLEYEGLFDANDFFKLIDDWFSQNGYDKNELRHVERVTEKGKFIDLEIMPNKVINDYTRYEVYVRMRIYNLTDAKIKRNGQEYRINRGKISILIDVFLATDIRNRMEGRPMHFLFRTVFNKFINRDYISRIEQDLMNDVKNFHAELKAYLNLSKYNQQA